MLLAVLVEVGALVQVVASTVGSTVLAKKLALLVEVTLRGSG